MSQFQVPYATNEKPFLLEYYSKENFPQKILQLFSNFAIVSHCPESQYMSGPPSIVDGNGPSWLASTNSHLPSEAGSVAGTA